MSRPKSEQPETLREAQTWTKFNHEHIRSGLCHPCASQAATGRQIGFSKNRGDILKRAIERINSFRTLGRSQLRRMSHHIAAENNSCAT